MDFVRPTLLLDKQKCLANLYDMVRKAENSKIRLRPHCKTHQSKEIAKWYYEAGIRHITVSSASMAKYFAEDGWKDITIAFPLNIHEINYLNAFNPDITINLLISSFDTASLLSRSATRKYNCYLKIDAGYHRCGFTLNDIPLISKVIQTLQLSELIHVSGLLAHFGNTYQARGKDQIMQIFFEGMSQMTKIRDHFRNDFPDLEISIGDTPSCSVLTDFQDVSEIRPGNFIFYDSMQQQIGSCTYEQIAIALACPVVEYHPERNEAVIYGGSVHLSKDYIIDDLGRKNYGAIALPGKENWSPPLSGCFVKALSQEHGIIHVPAENSHHFLPGKWIVVLPVHSCLTADAMGYYSTLEGNRIEMYDPRT